MLELIHFLPAIAVLLTSIIIIGSILLPNVFLPVLAFEVLALVGMSVLSGVKRHSIAVGFFTLAVIPIQIFGYGFGFIFSFIKRIILGNRECVGFTE
jgi:hypothetical protein